MARQGQYWCKYAEKRQENLHTLAEFQEIWNGRLDFIEMAWQRIKLPART